MASDARKDYLTKCACEALGATTPSNQWVQPPEAMYSSVHGSTAMQDFLENSEVRTLQVCTSPTPQGASELLCTTSVGLSSPQGPAGTSATVVFTKRTAEPLTAHNMPSAVVMSSLGDSPLQTLQLNIKELFAPMLLKDPQWKKQLDDRTRQTLEQLNAALTAALQLSGGEDDFTTILTPDAECQHWRRIDAGEDYTATSEQRNQARQYWDALRQVEQPLSRFSELTLGEMGKALQDVQNTLDALVQAGYKEARMKHFIQIIGSALDGYLKSRLADVDLWRDDYRKVARLLRESISVVDQWAADVAQLTGVFWQPPQWKSGPYRDEVLGWLRARMSQVLEMRAVVHQLSRCDISHAICLLLRGHISPHLPAPPPCTPSSRLL